MFWSVLPLIIFGIQLLGITIVPLALAEEVEDSYVTDDTGVYNVTYNVTDDATNSSVAEDIEEEVVEEEVEDSSVEEASGSSYGSGSFQGMSLMPLACVNYNNGYMIKYQIFSSRYNFQCHANAIGTYVVTISNYMRHYFNHQSLRKGADFVLPSDADYLNCVQLEQSTDTKLYARIGCLERENYMSTKLALHVYTDKKCSQPYDDGQTAEERKANGYMIANDYFQTDVTFRPPFYACESCSPQSLDGFSKQDNTWFDDDASAQNRYFDDWLDDYVPNDDAYAALQPYVNNEQIYSKDDDDNFYTADDDDSRRQLSLQEVAPVKDDFELSNRQRELSYSVYSGNDDSVQNWNMCTKVFKYSILCDDDCRSLDKFRLDEWPTSYIFLLGGMMAFIWLLMSLILMNRSKAYDKALIYADDFNAPDFGMMPCTMATIFLFSLICIGLLAGLRLVNVTVMVAAGGCIILLGYLIKITFSDNQPGLPQSGDPKIHTDYVMT